MSQNTLSTARKYHKWLMLFFGGQFLIWAITGFYMVIIDIHYIHGDSLVHNHQNKIDPNAISISVARLHQEYGELSDLSMGVIIDKSVYRFSSDGKSFIVDASNGDVLSPISEPLARAIAEHEYTGSGTIDSIELLTTQAPYEFSSRRLPAWRVNFDDFGQPAIYVSMNTGQIVTKRHQWWRLFDWMFRFHLMDYQDSESNNSLLFWFTLSGLLAAISGALLTYYRLVKDKSAGRKKAGLGA